MSSSLSDTALTTTFLCLPFHCTASAVVGALEIRERIPRASSPSTPNTSLMNATSISVEMLIHRFLRYFFAKVSTNSFCLVIALMFKPRFFASFRMWSMVLAVWGSKSEKEYILSPPIFLLKNCTTSSGMSRIKSSVNSTGSRVLLPRVPSMRAAPT